jgi:hypothetical protein
VAELHAEIGRPTRCCIADAIAVDPIVSARRRRGSSACRADEPDSDRYSATMVCAQALNADVRQ